ncbi:hypothetical protein [Nitrosospira sp. NpAV]|uniref:hypothetical protein n=1 Tax=Nitrosospira sp. NpAV TaxID=58133 RepID=UPI000B1E3D14|nr:hypothetical protein [Nitrosospira sp. NpAV]
MNNMPSKKSIISLAVGSAIVATLGAAPIASAAENPFVVQSLGKGYMVAEYHEGAKKDAYGDKKPGEGRCGMSMADTDKDGRVSKEEHARHSQIMFERMDANGDGYIDKEEADKMRMKHRRGHHSQGSGQGSSQGYGSPGQAPMAGEYEAGWGGKNLQHMKTMGD